MRVLKDKVLIAMNVAGTKKSDLIRSNDHLREGKVFISNSEQILNGESVIFGEDFEEVTDLSTDSIKYFLMHEQNIKVIFDAQENNNV